MATNITVTPVSRLIFLSSVSILLTIAKWLFLSLGLWRFLCHCDAIMAVDEEQLGMGGNK